MTRTSDRLAAVEDTLRVLVETVSAAADEQALHQPEILAAVGALGDQVANLAETVQAVMAARGEHDAGVAADAKRAATAAEGAFVATQALAAVVTAKPGPAELAAAVQQNTETLRQVHHAAMTWAVPRAPDPGPVAVQPGGGKT